MQGITIVYSVIVLIMSVVVHEVAHGYAALFLGDPTAKYAKRLTLNPLKHLDILGSVIVPLITVMSGGFLFGWAKPVPYNPYNLKNPRSGSAIIALAGPIANLCIALIAALSVNLFADILNAPTLVLLISIVFINIALMVFNLIPIYPLDGSKVLFFFLPAQYDHIKEGFIRYSLFIFIVFILFFSNYLAMVIGYIASFLLPHVGI